VGKNSGLEMKMEKLYVQKDESKTCKKKLKALSSRIECAEMYSCKKDNVVNEENKYKIAEKEIWEKETSKGKRREPNQIERSVLYMRMKD